jgi:hypothetical protein
MRRGRVVVSGNLRSRSAMALKCFSFNFPSPAGSNCPFFQCVKFIFQWSKMNTKKGQFEPAGLGKLNEKQFSKSQNAKVFQFVILQNK